jgi:hypothetical protein
VDKEAIEVVMDNGAVWRLKRAADSKLPAPEHYQYWLWMLDRFQAAAEAGAEDLPRVILRPPEIMELVGSPNPGGSQYEQIDDAFNRFANLIIAAHSVFHDVAKKAEFVGTASLGTLCSYVSWRVRPDTRQAPLEFAAGWVAPGPLLWASIKDGYLKSVPLAPLRKLSYVGQRLYTYLSKHCQPGSKFEISVRKLLPKIPMTCRSDQVRDRLDQHHDDLVKIGFLRDIRMEGRGQERKIIYERTEKDPDNKIT